VEGGPTAKPPHKETMNAAEMRRICRRQQAVSQQNVRIGPANSGKGYAFGLLAAYQLVNTAQLLCCGRDSVWLVWRLCKPSPHTYSVDFANFESGAPVDLVTGTVRVTFDPALSTVGSPVDAIARTIGRHTYTPSEVAFIFPFGQDTIFIYGLLNDTSVVGGTNDFFIDFNVLTFTGQTLMDYAVAGGLGPFFRRKVLCLNCV
jgi:hypothetical protein